MTKRSCGACTACCQGWLSSDVTGMAPYEPCRHCTASGCAIYDRRPRDPCADFSCAWLADDSPIPEALRPDRAGVIVLLDRDWQRWKVITAIATGASVPEPALDWLKNHAVQTGTPLVIYEFLSEQGAFKALRSRGFGPPAFTEAVRVSIGPKDIFRI